MKHSYKVWYYGSDGNVIGTENLYCSNIEKAYEMAEYLKMNHPGTCVYKCLERVRKY